MRLVPGIAMVSRYRRSDLGPDLLSAATITALLIPSGLAYGALAGLSPVAGLYTGVLGMIGFALFTTSRTVVVGPESQMAILVAAALAPLATSGSAEYVTLAAALALLCAVICVLAAVFRLGFLADYLSQPVLVGYLAGVALIIIVSQAGKLVGASTEGETLVDMIASFWQHRAESDWPSTLVGLAALAVILAARWVSPKLPASLLAVVALTVVSALLDLSEAGVAVVGEVPSGIPLPSIPDVGLGDVMALLPGALGLTLVVFADTVLTARAYALRGGGERIDANAELRALAAANAGAGLCSGFPVGASDSRTAVNADTGGRTQVVGLAAAVMTALFLIALTPLVRDLPSPALAGVVIVAAASLLRPGDFAALWRVRRVELLLALVTLVGVTVLGILPGILLAVGVNLVEIVYRLSRPAVDVLGPRGDSGRWRAVDPGDEAAPDPGLLVVRVGGPLLFTNAEFVATRIEAEADRRGEVLRWVVLDCEAVTLIDSNGALAVTRLADVADDRGVTLALARVTTALRQALRQAEVLGRFDDGRVFDRVEEAIQAYRDEERPG
ncbi:SulP family inorganic anion transporter [Pseudonocardia kunmingensis]|uniref:SulP family sulfate permease n=1 Tax=Pseudonocardia kunmingensis TaxID=630975 RepID=A0A543DWC2_9PSEU|nr:SulP family inorganic anion transporter [Pseudonocardia kunmingensis]TQM13633.1 SulP family sulfate permease [Pseudonocardia kunmingensis]